MSALDLDNLTEAQSARFNAAACGARREFNDLVENASTPHLHNIDWIVCSVASRNKYTSPLFQRLCSLAFIERELRVSEDIDTIIVADRPLAQCLRRHLENLSRPVAIRCTESPYARVWRISRPVRQYLISFTVLM